MGFHVIEYPVPVAVSDIHKDELCTPYTGCHLGPSSQSPEAKEQLGGATGQDGRTKYLVAW